MPVRLELPVPSGIRSVNAWYVPGDPPALVDCGLGGDAGWQRLHDAAAGLDLEGVRIHLTHGHVDHAGNAARLRREHGAELVAPPEEAPYVSTFRAEGDARNDAYAKALARHGMPAEQVARVRVGSDKIDAYTEDTPIDHDVGERVLLGDLEATALRTPGHTPGSVCYVTEEGMFTGDTLLERITSNAIELRDEDHGAHHRYVRTVEGLRPHVGRTALPGHHAPFEITDEVLDRHLSHHKQRARRVVEALHRERTAWDLLPEILPGLTRQDQLFLAMAEVVGHLHALEAEGRVARVERDGVRRFRRA